MGVEVVGAPDPINPKLDTFYISATGGSRGTGPTKLLGHVELIDDEPTFVPAAKERVAP